MVAPADPASRRRADIREAMGKIFAKQWEDEKEEMIQTGELSIPTVLDERGAIATFIVKVGY